MSDEKPKKGLSRRGFLRGSAAAAGAVATGGASTGGIAAAAAKTGAKISVGLPSFKILQSLKNAIGNMSSILDGTSNINMEDLQASLKGKLVLPRFPNRNNEYRDPIEEGRIDFTSHRRLLRTLRDIPSDKPIRDLLSNAVLKETYDRNDDNFAAHPAVASAINLRKIVDPLCDEKTTSADLIDGFKGYFVKLAEHAVQKPEDFVIAPVSDSYPTSVKHIKIREVEYYGERLEYKGMAGQNDVGELIDILKRYEKDDNSLSPLLERLEKVNEAWELNNKEKYLKETQERIQKRQAEQEAERKQKEAQRRAEARAEEQRRLDEYDAEQAEKRENPSKRSSRYISLTYQGKSEGRLQFSIADNDRGLHQPTRMDWMQWAQSINPEAKSFQVDVTDNGKTLYLDNTPDNAPVLRALFRKAERNGKFDVKLPNLRSGVDLNQSPEYEEQPMPLAYETPQTMLDLRIDAQTLSASEIINGGSVLGIDFSRVSRGFTEDALTQLHTIAGMKDALMGKGKAVGGYGTDDDTVTVIKFDTKHFKAINDQYGHGEGDIVLQELARRISDVAEYSTVIGRVGGDEIAMIYYDDRYSKDELLKMISDKLNKTAPILITSPKGQMESIGINTQRVQTQIVEFPKSLNRPILGMAA